MNPENVNPKKFEVERIIFTSRDGQYSRAIGYWVEDKMRRYAMRYNGEDSELGYPSSRGYPMWFQLPYDLNEFVGFLSQNTEPLN